MLYVWNQIKKRHFEVPKGGSPNRKENKSNPGLKKTVTLNRKEYIDMLKSMFKLMIGGLAQDRLKIMERMTKRAKNNSKFEIFKRLH